ncbi:MAG: CapA family protein [Peptococcaceae bacterium]|nr:CapA family protein [Peptococcaceae bacterium]
MLAFGLVLVGALLLGSLFGGLFKDGLGAAGPAELSGRTAGEPEAPAVPEDREFTILSTGDIMMHMPQTKAGRQADGSYDFAFMFEKVAPILHTADLVIGNLEVPLAGEAAGYSGYPMFNAPSVLAKNLKDAGFDVLTTANNHCLDKRYEGLCATLDTLDQAGLLHTGTFRTPEEQQSVLMNEVAGVKIAYIGATYGTNGINPPKDKTYSVNYIDQNKLLDQIAGARAQGAQYVIVMLHWGVEYQAEPSREQTALARVLLRGGADLILGNHPHVLQRGETVRVEELLAQSQGDDPGQRVDLSLSRASGKDLTKFVMYSQGNFISNQQEMEKNSSMLLKLTLGVDGATAEPYLKKAEYIPIYTQKKNRQGVSRHTVWPVEEAMALMDSAENPFNSEDRQRLPRAWDLILASQPALDLLNMTGWGLEEPLAVSAGPQGAEEPPSTDGGVSDPAPAEAA